MVKEMGQLPQRAKGVPADARHETANALHSAVVRLLRRVAAAGGPGARAVVVEGERRDRPVDGIALRTDLLMLALAPGGRERTTAEIGDLATAAGLRRDSTVTLASGDRAHTLVAG